MDDYIKLLVDVGLFGFEDSKGKLISFNQFKQNCTAMDYGSGRDKRWIIYYGQPGVKMVKVYPYMIAFLRHTGDAPIPSNLVPLRLSRPSTLNQYTRDLATLPTGYRRGSCVLSLWRPSR